MYNGRGRVPVPAPVPMPVPMPVPAPVRVPSPGSVPGSGDRVLPYSKRYLGVASPRVWLVLVVPPVPCRSRTYQ